jgi:hypothetical protein
VNTTKSYDEKASKHAGEEAPLIVGEGGQKEALPLKKHVIM